MDSKKQIKNFIISILILTISLITSNKVFAQLFDATQNPPSVKFRQINTPHFQIIYPTPLEQEAQRMANVLEAIIAEVSKSLGHSPKPISVILQTQGVVSNGFVQMAPRRSEFYTIPGQEFDSQDWLNSLAVHELRHVVQFDKLAPHLSAPLFEELKLALFGINLPPWFFEGDAVGIETALTTAGRGRQPSFELVLRANELAGKHYNYSKNYFGSYKSYTPGYYPLGYFMTTKIRRDHGPEILDQMLDRIKKFPIRPYNFSSSLKKFGGLGTHQLYLRTMEELDSLWGIQSEELDQETYHSLNKADDGIPTSYLMPYPLPDGGIVCLKGSKAFTPAITIIRDGKEKKIIKIGSQTEVNLNYAAHQLVWDEYRVDARYGQRSFNVICSYDLQTGRYEQLSHKSRLFSPALSPDGKRIVAVKVSTESIFNLVELDAVTGKELKVYPNPSNFTLQTPHFNNSGTQIVVTAVSEPGKTLLLYNCVDDSFKILLPPQHQMIARPCFYKDQIVYKANYAGLDDIYAFNINSKKITKLTSSPFGAYHPSVDEEKGLLFFNDYQASGYHIVSIDLRAADVFKPVSNTSAFLDYFEPLIVQENKPILFDSIPKKTYVHQDYKELSHLFYFHSIRPIVQANPFLNNDDFGFDLASNNKLNTLTATVGYLYNNALGKSQYNAAFTYLKYYPQFSFNYENRARLAYAPQVNGQDTLYAPFQWRENLTSLKVSLPYSANWLNKGFYANLQVETSYTNRYQLTLKPDGFLTHLNFPLAYQLSAGLNSSSAPRDLAPRWGQNFSLNYQHLPFDTKTSGENLFFESQFYFPGIFANHSFQASYNWQSNSGAYDFNIDIPRAYGYVNLTALQRLRNTLLLRYRFPIAYPDWEIGPLAYVKRIRGGFFADFENIGKGKGLRTYGAELKADMNLLRFYLPVFTLGGRIIIPQENSTKNPIFDFTLTYSY